MRRRMSLDKAAKEYKLWLAKVIHDVIDKATEIDTTLETTTEATGANPTP
jgi:hypothetical protein